MKKLILCLTVVAAIHGMISTGHAEEKYVAGGFEASGHINTGFGFNQVGKDTIFSGATLGRDGWTGFANAVRDTEFGFLLDEVELDLTKTFGENIKFRTDIDFGDATIGSFGALRLEQAYVTSNIAAGNGVELLFGRFDAPIGFESVDRNDNDTITRSSLFNFNIRPRTLTGVKLYYAFSDAVDLHFYLANNLRDGIAAFNADSTIIPAIGTRVGYTWGEEGTESTVGLSVAASPETPKAGKKLGILSYLGDLDWNIWLTDAFALGGEGIFRINSKNSLIAGSTKTTLFGGILNLNYVFSDVWDGTLKYALLRSNAGGSPIDAFDHVGFTVGKGLLHELSLAGGYQITDGAKFKAEYRADYTKYTGALKNLSHAVVGQMEYAF
ncbi:MAG: outer membrane beta-barrel protein [Deltaproteobacteria bacterium]|nr:outer membrane beta-barrel protein [Deltaproteobacteria bacterium]